MQRQMSQAVVSPSLYQQHPLCQLGQEQLALAHRPLLEESGHGSPVDLLPPHAENCCIDLSCSALSLQVLQQLHTGALQPQQLRLRGGPTAPQRCCALRQETRQRGAEIHVSISTALQETEELCSLHAN